MTVKLLKEFSYYLKSKIFTLIYIILFGLFAILLINIDARGYITEGLVYLNIILIILNIYFAIYLNTSKLYEFSLYFSYFRKPIFNCYTILYLEYSLISSILLYLIYSIVGYFKVEFYSFNLNLLFMLIYNFILVIFINGIVGLFFNNVLGIIVVFFLDLVILFMSLLTTDSNLLPIILYNGDYYYAVESIILISYFIIIFTIYYLIYKFKERR